MLEPDRDQIEIFTEALFRYAGKDGFVSLRAFYDDASERSFRITPAGLSGGLNFLIDAAEDDARRAANNPKKIVFCPPIATFTNKDHAREIDIAKGLALSVECDQHPREAIAKLEAVLGPATIVVASGGKWTDPATGQIEDKLHLHWRLKEPATGKDNLEKLKRARELATRIVGGDPSNTPVNHPIRWPGSWHRKGEPTLCQTETVNPDREIDLGIALAALTKAAPAAAKPSSKANGQGADPFTSYADSRDPPNAWIEAVQGIITGSNYHNAIVQLAAKMLTAGMSDGAAINMLRSLMQSSTAEHDRRWTTRFADIPRAVETAREKLGIWQQQPPQQPPQPTAPVWIDMSRWDDTPPPERKWSVLDRAPANQAGLFSGEGGTGKSIIELMRDVAHVIGGDWLGSLPEPGPAFYLGAEDEEDEIHRRLAAIAAQGGVTFRHLVDGGLKSLCLLGQDATLCTASKSGKVEITNLYRWLYQMAGDLKPKNISIDTLTRAFAGNEIDRVQVYAFAMHMQALAMVTNGGSVTVLAHPSLQGISSGSGISGSTAWHGAFRFRQYLTGVKAEAGEQPDSNLRQIEFKKNQYGPTGETIVLRYQRGLFLPEAGVSNLDKLARERKVDEIFLLGLQQLIRQGRDAMAGMTSPEFGPILIAELPEAKKQHVRKKELIDAMTRLLGTGKIHIGKTDGPASKAKKCLLPGAAPEPP